MLNFDEMILITYLSSTYDFTYFVKSHFSLLHSTETKPAYRISPPHPTSSPKFSNPSNIPMNFLCPLSSPITFYLWYSDQTAQNIPTMTSCLESYNLTSQQLYSMPQSMKTIMPYDHHHIHQYFDLQGTMDLDPMSICSTFLSNLPFTVYTLLLFSFS